ncbi:MAG: amidohydrolase family protein [Actinomycetota bacterium]|nr:amidohydrolase family protein [Actinomycetota bacterium]
MTIDAHTHIFPPDVIERRELYARRDASFNLIYGNPGARMVNYDRLLSEMEEAGVDRAIVCGFPWRSHDLCRYHNNYMIEAVKASRGRLIGLATVNPLASKSCDKELERAFSEGLSGVGEISPDAQGFKLDDENTMGRIANAVGEAGYFLLLHVNEDVGHAYPGKTRTTPAGIYKLLTKFHEAKIVLAHWGGGLVFYELMPEVAKVTSNVFYDTAASPFLYRKEIYRIAIDIAGPARILFGTDFPLLRIKRHLDEIEQAGLKETEKKMIFSLNARNLLGDEFQE